MTDDIEWTETEPGFWESSEIRESGYTAEYFVARLRRIGGRKPISGHQPYEFAIDYFPNDIDPPHENVVVGQTSVELSIAQSIAVGATNGLFRYHDLDHQED